MLTRSGQLEELQRMAYTEMYKKGFVEGVAHAANPIIERYYIATMLALHELYGFGEDRVIRTINRIEQYMVECINDDELCERAKAELHVDIEMGEAINRAQPMSQDKRKAFRQKQAEEKKAEEERKKQEELKHQQKRERRKKNRQNRQNRRHKK